MDVTLYIRGGENSSRNRTVPISAGGKKKKGSSPASASGRVGKKNDRSSSPSPLGGGKRKNIAPGEGKRAVKKGG